MKLILIRHGESYKNIEDRHGGVGNNLTNLGRKQIIEFRSKLKDLTLTPIQIFHSNVPQTYESAELLAIDLKCPLIFDERIKPLNIGLLDGLSREEASSQFPQIASLMELWRNGEIEIHELLLPEGEDLESFWNRGCSFMDYIKTFEGLNIIVGTRSILILLISIALNRSIKKGGGYKTIEINNSSFITFDFLNDSFSIDNSLTNIQL